MRKKFRFIIKPMNIFQIKTKIQIYLNAIKWFLLDLIVLPVFWIVKTFINFLIKKQK